MWKGEKVKRWGKYVKSSPFLGALFNVHTNLTNFARFNSSSISMNSADPASIVRPPTIN